MTIAETDTNINAQKNTFTDAMLDIRSKLELAKEGGTLGEFDFNELVGIVDKYLKKVC